MYLVSSLAKSAGVEPSVVTFVPGLERRAVSCRRGARDLPAGDAAMGNATLHARERRSLAATLRSLRLNVVHVRHASYGFVSREPRAECPWR